MVRPAANFHHRRRHHADGREVPGERAVALLAYFAVSSCDTSAAQLAKLGGKVMAPAFDTPYGRIAVVTDPFGAAFAIIQLAQQPPR